MQKVAVVHGPNINLLGVREPEVYGTTNYNEMNKQIKQKAEELELEVDIFQSNHEGEIVDYLQGLIDDSAGVIINPAGLTHTSVVLKDTLIALRLPVIEVHISNIYRREDYRHKSITASAAVGQIAGLGVRGYFLALQAMNELLREEKY
ncbi:MULTISPECIES: type II 3-dehydroquinate dehydratase [unclassified Halanaerobium]|uniref:type II 3-dehydroquinate dehydratase n=1 Tax=unclassified Halanaerobium TaxID=2641197 RepID=UPI000DF4B364|nr:MULTISPECIES: type II 3-dehydroquinate dehydratase [unclassified Halanaerobium]RCW50534.1 3-dehydroquinate dehydratase [Halanaerobium sp. MA284_MarDTE_T2]RCW86017.1 3-dehydroquinate dehydratase [Halanaerobium sp. DL-01]